MLSVIMLSVILPSVNMLSFAMTGIIMLSFAKVPLSMSGKFARPDN